MHDLTMAIEKKEFKWSCKERTWCGWYQIEEGFPCMACTGTTKESSVIFIPWASEENPKEREKKARLWKALAVNNVGDEELHASPCKEKTQERKGCDQVKFVGTTSP